VENGWIYDGLAFFNSSVNEQQQPNRINSAALRQSTHLQLFSRNRGLFEPPLILFLESHMLLMMDASKRDTP